MANESVLTRESAKVERLITLLEEAKRASREATQYFVEPAPDTLRKSTTRRHHLIFGRRGSGKTSLLHKAEADLLACGSPVAFIDMDRNKSLAYADVLVTSLRAIMRAYGRWLEKAHPSLESLRDRFASAEKELEQLLLNEDEVAHSQSNEVAHEQASSTKGGVGFGFSGFGAGVKGRRATEESSSLHAGARFTSKKVDQINRRCLFYRDLLEELTAEIGQEAFVMVDDLYHLRLSEQARVLGFLHGLVKGTNVWLKIGTVRKRSRWYFQDGSQPIGIKTGDDADEIVLDRPLELISETKEFLLAVLRVFLGEAGLKVEDFLSRDSQDRLMRASGGVPRDFLNILATAIRMAKQRVNNAQGNTSKLVITEDIYEAVEFLGKSKMEEFNEEVPNEERHHLQDMVQRMVSHCFKTKYPFFLIETGRDPSLVNVTANLEDLKLIHCINRRINRNNTSYSAYMLDMSLHVAQRRQATIKMNYDLADAQGMLATVPKTHVFQDPEEAPAT